MLRRISISQSRPAFWTRRSTWQKPHHAPRAAPDNRRFTKRGKLRSRARDFKGREISCSLCCGSDRTCTSAPVQPTSFPPPHATCTCRTVLHCCASCGCFPGDWMGAVVVEELGRTSSPNRAKMRLTLFLLDEAQTPWCADAPARFSLVGAFSRIIWRIAVDRANEQPTSDVSCPKPHYRHRSNGTARFRPSQERLWSFRPVAERTSRQFRRAGRHQTGNFQ